MDLEGLGVISKELLLPLDESIADLYDKSLRLDSASFAAEVSQALQKLPSLMEVLNIDALADPLETEIGDAMVKELSDG